MKRSSLSMMSEGNRTAHTAHVLASHAGSTLDANDYSNDVGADHGENGIATWEAHWIDIGGEG
jgi:hypothetical protein